MQSLKISKQRTLFGDNELIEEKLPLADTSKRLVGGLLALRKKVAESDESLVPMVNLWIEKARALGKATPTQIEEMILYAIEVHQARNSEEISEDLKLEQKFIKEKLVEMEKKKLVRFVRRVVPGMFKKSYMVKSNRIDEPDGD